MFNLRCASSWLNQINCAIGDHGIDDSVSSKADKKGEEGGSQKLTTLELNAYQWQGREHPGTPLWGEHQFIDLEVDYIHIPAILV